MIFRYTRALPPVGVTIAISFAARLLFAATVGYGVDEAYAVSVARPLSLSYFDHPPLHFWIAGGWSALTGSIAPLMVRLPFLVMFCLTQWAIGDLTRRQFGEEAARIAVLALSVSGVLGVTSASWVLPDGPLLCSSAVAVWALARVLLDPSADTDQHVRARCWLLAGVAFALAVLSKYHALLLMAGVTLFILADAPSRAQLRTPWPWLAVVLAACALVPVVWWNAQHDWASLRFQGGRARAAHWSIAPFAEMLVGQLVWLLPWIAIPLVRAVRFRDGSIEVRRGQQFLLSVAALPVVLFSLIPLGGARGLPHWTAPGWLFVFPVLGAWAASGGRRFDDSMPMPWPRWLAGSVAATSILAGVIMLHASTGLGDRWLSATARDRDPSRDGVSWAPAIDRDADVLFVRSWIQGGQLGASTVRTARIVCLCSDPHHFAYRPGARLVRGERGVLLERRRLRPNAVPAPDLGGDSLIITVRDTVPVGRGIEIVRYDVTRR